MGAIPADGVRHSAPDLSVQGAEGEGGGTEGRACQPAGGKEGGGGGDGAATQTTGHHGNLDFPNSF